MGYLSSPAWDQVELTRLFEEMTCVEVYIDDIAVFNDDLNSHLNAIAKVLTILSRQNFSVKAVKCKWIESKVPWLGHVMQPDGFRPNPEKVSPILKICFPQTVTQMRSFIGIVNCYHDFWHMHAHIMAPLSFSSNR